MNLNTPVQRKADASTTDSADSLGAIASAGLSGGGGSLPHLNRIQESFGNHDVSGVTAHVGGPTADACDRMGALGFATGQQVAFREPPDLHTAAHEAAHTVQQQAGAVQRDSGSPSDPLEQHADQVADLVVTGRSSESVLDAVAGSRIGAGEPPIQRKEDQDQDQDRLEREGWNEEKQRTADSFLDLFEAQMNAVDFWADLATIESPPKPDWKDILAAVSLLALGGLMKGLISVGTKAYLDANSSSSAVFALNAGFEAAKKSVEKSAPEAIRTGKAQAKSEGNAKKAALFAFEFEQKEALRHAKTSAREAFRDSAGLPSRPRLTRRQMIGQQAINLLLAETAKGLLHRELLVGWMRLLGGKNDPIDTADLNELDNKGTLGLEVVGRESLPVQISRAQAEGLGPSLRNQLTGQRVSDWMGRNGGTGINLVVTTRLNDYFMSDADRERLLKAGEFGDESSARYVQDKYQQEQETRRGIHEGWADMVHEKNRIIPEHASRLASINFGLGRRPDGRIDYISDFGGWYMSDRDAGYDAGRYFLSEVRSNAWLFEQIAKLVIPDVES